MFPAFRTADISTRNRLLLFPNINGLWKLSMSQLQLVFRRQKSWLPAYRPKLEEAVITIILRSVARLAQNAQHTPLDLPQTASFALTVVLGLVVALAGTILFTEAHEVVLPASIF